MLPLILIVLGISVALTAYELAPQVHARVDDYVRALRSAHESHRAADAHLVNARRAGEVAGQHVRATIDAQRQQPVFQQPAPVFQQQPVFQPPAPDPVFQSPVPAPTPAPAPLLPITVEPPANVADAHAGAAQVTVDAAVDHAIAAIVANQQAAQSTAEAAQSARTAGERRGAADSAARVLERGKRIEGALASLGVGQCGVRSYPHVTVQIRDALLAKLHAEGMTVTGDDPWDIDAQTGRREAPCPLGPEDAGTQAHRDGECDLCDVWDDLGPY